MSGTTNISTVGILIGVLVGFISAIITYAVIRHFYPDTSSGIKILLPFVMFIIFGIAGYFIELLLINTVSGESGNTSGDNSVPDPGIPIPDPDPVDPVDPVDPTDDPHYTDPEDTDVDEPDTAGPYVLEDDYVGEDLFSSEEKDFIFFTHKDPTNGIVNYDKHLDLIETHETNSDIPEGSARTNVGQEPKFQKGISDEDKADPKTVKVVDAIRIQSRKEYDTGLFVLDCSHMPEGLATWPAFWLTGNPPSGSSWAVTGEIDVIEGVNDTKYSSTKNAVTLHTNTPVDDNGNKLSRCIQDIPYINHKECNTGGGNRPGTYLQDDEDDDENWWWDEDAWEGFLNDKNDDDKKKYREYKEARHCGHNNRNYCPYLGCGVLSDNDNTFGHEYNKNGGGITAVELTKDGKISVWFWPRGDANTPTDFTDPSNFVGDARNIVKFNKCPGQFKRMRIILNTTICGDWAGDNGSFNNAFNKVKANVNFNEDYSKTNHPCTDYVNGGNFDASKAYWEINTLKVYKVQE